MAVFPHHFWLYYFNIDDIDAAAARVRSAGGQVMMGPHEVPGGAWILQATDPQGGMFALTGPKIK
jgi:predicted enzyme related to lactoylglutathione lyase